MFIDAMPTYQHKNICIDFFSLPKKKKKNQQESDHVLLGLIYIFYLKVTMEEGESKSCIFSLKTLKNSS